MDNRYIVRIMENEIHHFKNVNYGKVNYMNYGCINSSAEIRYKDIVGIYGQNGSGKTALVEALDTVGYILQGEAIPFSRYGGLLSTDNNTAITTEFYIEHQNQKYKVIYEAFLRANNQVNKIEIYKESLTYWSWGASSWISKRDLEFENPDYSAADLLTHQDLTVHSSHIHYFRDIPFLTSMQNLALISAQNYRSVFFNENVRKTVNEMKRTKEVTSFCDIITGLMQFGTVDLDVVTVRQLGDINLNHVIPINMHDENDHSIRQGVIPLIIAGQNQFPLDLLEQIQSSIQSINIAIKAIVPHLQIEVEKKMETEKPDGKKYVQIEVYSDRDGKRFPIRYESEGIKRIISILNYLISVYNNEGVCLVVDELDSGIFEYLLGELLGMMSREMKGQLIFTSHNLRVLEKLDTKNIICSTTNPDNRYIRLTGVEKNNNRRDFYIRAITVGGQKENLYDEDDLAAMGHAFRKAGNINKTDIKLTFSNSFENKLKNGNVTEAK